MITVSLQVNGVQTFTSENIKLGTFSLNRYSTSAIAPEFGNVSAGELLFSIDTTTTNATLVRGDVITGAWIDGATTTSIGEFVVTNLVKGYNELSVTCLDKMILLDGEADLTGITYPITATNFLNAIYRDGLHLTVTIDSNVNGAVELGDPTFEAGTTYRQVLSRVCECMGANAWYKDGLNIGFYKTVATTLTDEEYVAEDTTEDGFTVNVEVTNELTAKSVEITNNVITVRIVSNPFLAHYTAAQMTTLAATIKSNIGNVTWYGGNVSILPDPTLDIMSSVTIDTMDGSTKLFPITSITYGINEDTSLVSKIDSANNDYNYSLTRDITVLKNEVNNLEIGGVNLLLDTNAPSLAKVYAEKNRYFSNSDVTQIVGSIVEINDAPVDVQYGARLQVNQPIEGRTKALTWYNGSNVRLVEGETYTLSAYYRLKSGNRAYLSFMLGVTSYILNNSQEITNTEWKRYSYTFEYTSAATGGTDGARVYVGIIGNASSGTIVEMCGFQLEQGTKATAYNRNSELEAQIQEVNNYFWHDTEGAHVSNVAKDISGKNTLVTSGNFQVRTGTTADATFGTETIIGHTGTDQRNIRLTDSSFALRIGTESVIRAESSSGTPYLVLGKFSTSSQNEPNLYINSSGIRLRTYTSTDAQFSYDTTTGSPTIVLGRTGSGQSNVYVTNSALQLRKGSTPYINLTTGGTIEVGGTANKKIVITESTLTLQGGTRGSELFAPIKMEGWVTGSGTTSAPYKCLSEVVNGAWTMRSSYDYVTSQSSRGPQGTTCTETVSGWGRIYKTTLLQSLSSSTTTERVFNLDSTNGVEIQPNPLTSGLTIAWDGKITSAVRTHSLGGATFNFGDGSVSHMAFWGNANNKVGVSATNTAESKNYAILARASAILLYNYTDSQNTWSLQTKPLRLTVTRTENAYFDATRVGYLYAYEQAGHLFLYVNLLPSANIPANTPFFEIGRITGWNAQLSVAITPYAQNGSGVLLCQVTSNGVIQVGNYGNQTVSGACRGTLTVPKA